MNPAMAPWTAFCANCIQSIHTRPKRQCHKTTTNKRSQKKVREIKSKSKSRWVRQCAFGTQLVGGDPSHAPKRPVEGNVFVTCLVDPFVTPRNTTPQSLLTKTICRIRWDGSNCVRRINVLDSGSLSVRFKVRFHLMFHEFSNGW